MWEAVMPTLSFGGVSGDLVGSQNAYSSAQEQATHSSCVNGSQVGNLDFYPPEEVEAHLTLQEHFQRKPAKTQRLMYDPAFHNIISPCPCLYFYEKIRNSYHINNWGGDLKLNEKKNHQ